MTWLPEPQRVFSRTGLFATAIVVCLMAVEARGFEVRKKIGPFEASVKFHRYPPVLGENGLEIELRDEGGKPVTDARVFINYYMPPMPRMAPMNYKTDGKPKGTRYHATMNLIMSGPWVIVIKITRAEKTSTLKIPIDVP